MSGAMIENGCVCWWFHTREAFEFGEDYYAICIFDGIPYFIAGFGCVFFMRLITIINVYQLISILWIHIKNM